MTIPTENLDAMIQFLTDVSETNGDHFMRAADMLRAQQVSIAELEAQVSMWRKVESQWDAQRVGHLCGLSIGDDIRPAVEPTLVQLTIRVAELERQLNGEYERAKEREIEYHALRRKADAYDEVCRKLDAVGAQDMFDGGEG